MKLLLVDDEKITREGLISSIDWESLGIDCILEADDGINGLSAALKERPDIILCDIRMPRMNGIQFIERLKDSSFFPSVVFMSGYSDKEYLKAAIKLKAVNYVEKPLNPEEVRETVLAAVNERKLYLKTQKNEAMDTLRKSSQLALCLTKPYSDEAGNIRQLAAQLNFSGRGYFITYIVSVNTFEQQENRTGLFLKELEKAISFYHLQFLSVRVHATYSVFFLYGETAPSATAVSFFEQKLIQFFYGVAEFYIGKGTMAKGFGKAYQSYASAVVALQSSFFFPVNTLLDSAMAKTAGNTSADSTFDSLDEFKQQLKGRDEDALWRYLKQLCRFYEKNTSALPSQAKAQYFRLLNAVNDARKELGITLPFKEQELWDREDKIMEALENCFCFAQLHDLLTQKVTLFLQSAGFHNTEDPTIFLVKEYVHKNYQKESLSIKEISDHVFLSVSYLCTYFKNQTGTTLNQYITDYRMQKAILLLNDPRYQIANISAEVGYSNGNYFSKSFKKYTGLSPSKYREKNME